MKQLIAAVLIAGAICVAPRSSRASTCVIPDVHKAYERARAVFLGEVVGMAAPINPEASPRSSDRLFKIRFKVHRAWKGVFSSTFEVFSSDGPAHFGLYEGGNAKKYIVYADPLIDNGVYPPHKTAISRCSRTALVLESDKRSGLRLDQIFDRTNGAADVKILDWRYPPLTFSARRTFPPRLELNRPAGSFNDGISSSVCSLLPRLSLQ